MVKTKAQIQSELDDMAKLAMSYKAIALDCIIKESSYYEILGMLWYISALIISYTESFIGIACSIIAFGISIYYMLQSWKTYKKKRQL